MKLKLKQYLVIAFGLSIITCGAICIFHSFNNQHTQNKTLNKIILGAENSMLPAAVWLADSMGYFKDEGLEVVIKKYDSGRLSFLSMLKDNAVDISTVAPTPIVFKSFARKDFCILATFVYSDEDVKVIVRSDKGINNASDLKARKIGTPAGTTGHFFLDTFLSYNKIKSSSVQMVDISPSELPKALLDNIVDAIIIWEPHAYNAKQLLQNRALQLESSDVYRETFNFTVMKKFAKNNPESLIKFLKAINRATQYIKNNKEKSQRLVANKMKLNHKVVTALWDDFVFKISLDQSLLLTLEDEARWAIVKDLVGKKKTVPNYLDYICLDTMEQVKPKGITIIR